MTSSSPRPAHWLHIAHAAAIATGDGATLREGDVWIREDQLVAVGEERPAFPPSPEDDVLAIDGRGLLVAPPFIDLHVHLREPGGEAAETIESGCAAALAGGFGLIHAMPNTNPVCDEPARAIAVRREATNRLPVEVASLSALSRGLRGRELVDLDAMAAADVAAFSDDGAWLADERLAREAFRWSARAGRTLWQHCEDFERTGAGVVHACACGAAAGLPGIPSEGEITAIERDIRLASDASAPFHVCHLSTRGGVDAVRIARRRGERVTAEVTPHHLVLTAEDAVRGGPDFKMKPPLRDASDADALLDALVDGTIGAIATDHAPHTSEAKARGWSGAPFGVVGLETAFAVLHTRLVETGRLRLARLVEALTRGPAEIAGRPAPRLVETGLGPRLVLVDLVTRRDVDPAAFRSRSRNTPFTGWPLTGWPIAFVHGFNVHRLTDEGRERFRTSPGPA